MASGCWNLRYNVQLLWWGSREVLNEICLVSDCKTWEHEVCERLGSFGSPSFWENVAKCCRRVKVIQSRWLFMCFVGSICNCPEPQDFMFIMLLQAVMTWCLHHLFLYIKFCWYHFNERLLCNNSCVRCQTWEKTCLRVYLAGLMLTVVCNCNVTYENHLTEVRPNITVRKKNRWVNKLGFLSLLLSCIHCQRWKALFAFSHIRCILWQIFRLSSGSVLLHVD